MPLPQRPASISAKKAIILHHGLADWLPRQIRPALAHAFAPKARFHFSEEGHHLAPRPRRLAPSSDQARPCPCLCPKGPLPFQRRRPSSCTTASPTGSLVRSGPPLPMPLPQRPASISAKKAIIL